MRTGFSLSLRGILMLSILFLMIPALLFSSTGFLQARALEKALQPTRDIVEDLNRSINQNIVAPFYLSPNSIDPCNPEALDRIDSSGNWQIAYAFSGKTDVLCNWSYFQKGELLVTDYWKSYDRKLASREYYQDGVLIATDTFYVMDASNQLICLKQRIYEVFHVSECYFESGFLISVDPLDTYFSSLPPMLYWFSYR